MANESTDAELLQWEKRQHAAITGDPVWRLLCYREAMFLLEQVREETVRPFEGPRAINRTASQGDRINIREHRRGLRTAHDRRPRTLPLICARIRARVHQLVSGPATGDRTPPDRLATHAPRPNPTIADRLAVTTPYQDRAKIRFVVTKSEENAPAVLLAHDPSPFTKPPLTSHQSP